MCETVTCKVMKFHITIINGIGKNKEKVSWIWISLLSRNLLKKKDENFSCKITNSSQIHLRSLISKAGDLHLLKSGAMSD